MELFWAKTPIFRYKSANTQVFELMVKIFMKKYGKMIHEDKMSGKLYHFDSINHSVGTIDLITKT